PVSSTSSSCASAVAGTTTANAKPASRAANRWFFMGDLTRETWREAIRKHTRPMSQINGLQARDSFLRQRLAARARCALPLPERFDLFRGRRLRADAVVEHDAPNAIVAAAPDRLERAEAMIRPVFAGLLVQRRAAGIREHAAAIDRDHRRIPAQLQCAAVDDAAPCRDD